MDDTVDKKKNESPCMEQCELSGSGPRGVVVGR